MGATTALLCFSVLGWAQFKPANPASPKSQPKPGRQELPEQAPSFSVKVDLVRLLVSVRDRSGAPVTKLDKADFQEQEAMLDLYLTAMDMR